jgi:urea carboxylase
VVSSQEVLEEVSVVFPPQGPDLRVDGWIEQGSEVSAHYDPMLAKLIVYGKDRAEAIERLQQALDQTRLGGIATNLDYLRQISRWDRFLAGDVATQALNSVTFLPAAVEVVVAGTYTTVQDYPGRVGYWDIGVPPSGPMDDRAFRLANRLVGNSADAAGLE